MVGTRLQILVTLQRNGRETVENLARSLELVLATIRHHMDILQRDHLISFQEVKRPTGRPEYSFFLTEAGHEALPKNYGRLLDSLFQEISSHIGGGALALKVTSIAAPAPVVAKPAFGLGLADHWCPTGQTAYVAAQPVVMRWLTH